MRPKLLTETLTWAISKRFSILIKGRPGVGKTDIVTQVCNKLGYDLYISHPVVSDPTDYKGLPFPTKDGKSATFLPFGDLNKLIQATKPLVFFFDDLGQAPASVQAAVMQLLLSRRINGHKVSEHVIFISATNRRQDQAGVQGILEPVKSRFASILELEVHHEDFIEWGLKNDLPAVLLGFVRFRPNILDEYTPSKDIINNPSPRTLTHVGRMMNANIPKNPLIENELFLGASGEAFATEFSAFLKVFRELPDIKKIIKSPDSVEVPTKPQVLYALSGALSRNSTKDNFGQIMKYTKRLQSEFQVCVVKDAITRDDELVDTSIFRDWAHDKADLMI